MYVTTITFGIRIINVYTIYLFIYIFFYSKSLLSKCDKNMTLNKFNDIICV